MPGGAGAEPTVSSFQRLYLSSAPILGSGSSYLSTQTLMPLSSHCRNPIRRGSSHTCHRPPSARRLTGQRSICDHQTRTTRAWIWRRYVRSDGLWPWTWRGNPPKPHPRGMSDTTPHVAFLRPLANHQVGQRVEAACLPPPMSRAEEVTRQMPCAVVESRHLVREGMLKAENRRPSSDVAFAHYAPVETNKLTGWKNAEVDSAGGSNAEIGMSLRPISTAGGAGGGGMGVDPA